MLRSLWTAICLTICFRKYNLKRRERNWDEWRSMATRFWFCSSIFRISWLWIGFETNVEILHVWWSRRFISVVHFSRFSFFVLRLRSLEASFKFQWASKKEDEEACQSVAKRAGKNDFSSLVWTWRMGKSLLLLCRSARTVIMSWEMIVFSTSVAIDKL